MTDFKPIKIQVVLVGEKGGGGSGNFGHRGRPGHLGGSVGGSGGGALGASAGGKITGKGVGQTATGFGDIMAGDIKIGKYWVQAADAKKLDKVIEEEAQSAFEDAWSNGRISDISNNAITDNILNELHDGSLTPLVQHAIGKFKDESARMDAHAAAAVAISIHAGNQATKLAQTKYRDMKTQAASAKADAAKMPQAPAKSAMAMNGKIIKAMDEGKDNSERSFIGVSQLLGGDNRVPGRVTKNTPDTKLQAVLTVMRHLGAKTDAEALRTWNNWASQM